MTRRRLLVLAVLLATFIGAWWTYLLLHREEETNRSEAEFEIVEPILKSEPLNPYPKAVKVNLLIHDLETDRSRGVKSSKPQGIVLNAAQRGEFELAVRKYTLLNDGSVGAVACFEPHHFFRYYDAAGKKIGEISVCFCCGNSRFEPTVMEPTGKQWVDVDIERAEHFVKKLGLQTDMHCPKGQ